MMEVQPVTNARPCLAARHALQLAFPSRASNNLFNTCKLVVKLQAFRICQSAGWLDRTTAYDMLDWQLDFLAVDSDL